MKRDLMTMPLDLGNQLALFEQPRPRYGMPPGVYARYELAFSEPVKAELVARLNERPGDWLEWRDFADIRERHEIGFCMGHVLYKLATEGRALKKAVYFGAERPGDPFKPYLGYENFWGSVLFGPAPEQKLRRTS